MSEWIGEARRHAELLMRGGDLVLHTLLYNLIADIERAEARACRTCAFWTLELKPYSDGVGMRKARSAGFGACASEKFVHGYGIEFENLALDSVPVEDDEGWAFVTGPLFGCVHWKAKEPELCGEGKR